MSYIGFFIYEEGSQAKFEEKYPPRLETTHTIMTIENTICKSL